MYFKSKKVSLLILFITSVLLSRLVFGAFNDPEGPNLLIVMVLAVILYFLSLAIRLPSSSTAFTGIKRLLLGILVQAVIAAGFYFCLS